jgi:hypothetical protein
MSLSLSKRPGEADLERLREHYAKTLAADVLREESPGGRRWRHGPDRGDGHRAAPLRFKKNSFFVLVDVDSPEAARARCQGLPGRARPPGAREPSAALQRGALRWLGPVRTSRPLGVLERLGVTLTERLPGRDPARSDAALAERLGQASLVQQLCSGLVQMSTRAPRERWFLRSYLRARDGDFDHRVAALPFDLLQKANRVRQIELHDWPPVIELLRLADTGLAELE